MDRSPPRSAIRILLVLLAPLAAPAAGAEWTGYAVIVGISDYPGNASDLATCRDDAMDLYNTLVSDRVHWPAPNIKLLVDSAATWDEIHWWLDDRFAQADELKGDVCLFYFSGHGTRVPDAPPIDESGAGEDGKDEALCPYDYPGRVILDDDLAAWLLPYSTKRICLIVDTCYAGGMAKSVEGSPSERWADGFAADVLASASAARGGVSLAKGAAAGGAKDVSDTGQTGIVMLMACEEGQYSYEDPMLRNAIFTFYLVEALRRKAADADANGFVSAEEAFAYARPRTVAWGPAQAPEMYDTLVGELDIITAADRPLDVIVTPEDFPFGAGCGVPDMESGAVTRAVRRGARPRATGAALVPVALGLVALLLLRRRPSTRSRGTPAIPTRRAAAAAGPAHWCAGRGVGRANAPGPPGRRGPPRRARGCVPGASGGAAAALLLCAAFSAGCLVPLYQAGVPGDGDASGESGSVANLLRIGPAARAGLIVPFAEENASYRPAAQVGVFVAAAFPKGFECEAGVDLFVLEGEEKDVEGTVLSLRGDVIFGSTGRARSESGAGRRGEAYFHAGPRVLVAQAHTYWGGGRAATFGVGIGAGLRAGDRGWDVRLTAEALPWSGNIKGLWGLTAGWRF